MKFPLLICEASARPFEEFAQSLQIPGGRWQRYCREFRKNIQIESALKKKAGKIHEKRSLVSCNGAIDSRVRTDILRRRWKNTQRRAG
jgi:hypothetical protein